MNVLLDSLQNLFSQDDGSLPEIFVHGLSGAEIVEIYTMIRQVNRFLVGSPFFRHRGDHQDKPLDSVPNAAQLVVAGEADPFHFLTRGIVLGETSLPDLGVFVFDHAVALDYEKGPAWGTPQIKGLFELLRMVFAKAARPRVRFDADTGSDENPRFTGALATFCGIALAD